MAIVTAVVTLTGCNYDTDDSVYPGYTIYSEAKWATTLSMDGVNIAMRFAILCAEVEASGGATTMEDTEDNWATLGDFTYLYDGLSYSKKDYLMGTTDDVSITEDSDISGTYILNYSIKSGYLAGSMSRAQFDPLKRKGAYVITTNNTPLTSTSSSSPWEITICNDGSYDEETADDDDDDFSDYITFQPEDPTLCMTTYTAKIWHAGNGKFEYTVSSEFEYIAEEVGDWDVDSAWIINDANIAYTNFTDLTFNNTINSDVEATYNSSGGESIAGYTVTYLTSSPLIYNYSTTPYSAIGGTEEATIYDVSEYYYPEDTAVVETSRYGVRTLYYNDETLIF